MLLKRLAQSFSPQVQGVVHQLAEVGVLTTEQVLVTSRTKLLKSIHPPTVPTNNVELAEATLDELYAICMTRTAAQPIRVNLDTPRLWEGTGARGIDELFGNWPGVGILAFSGGRACGKSLLALHTTLRALAADPEATAWWIDTEGAFNALRAQGVVSELAKVVDVDDSVLDRLTISHTFRLEPELFDVVAGLWDQPNLRVLVVDNITAMFRDVLMGSTAQGHAAMVSILEQVAEVTYSKELLTIVTSSPSSSSPTNPLSSFSATSSKPGLGASFGFAVDAELLFQDTSRVFALADEGERERKAGPGLRALVEVLKSRISRSGAWAVFETDGTAIFDVVARTSDDEEMLRRSAGIATGRPAIGPLAQTLSPAILPLRRTTQWR